MKRLLTLMAFVAVTIVSVYAQSSMTDEQVMRFVVKEQESGSTQQQIVTRLMQRGVDINQIRRVRKKYERIANKDGLGAVSNSTNGKKYETRLRTSKTDEDADEAEKNSPENLKKYSSKMKQSTKKRQKANTFDEDDKDFMEMQEELSEFMPIDSLDILRNEIKQELEQRLHKKVFGRDIFNNDELSFEPNMNIATPDNYVLGPGDAVFVDVYGASVVQIESTVSPDGYINIEDFGPVQVSGLTVAQANARLRQTLGARYSSSKVKLTVGQTKTIMVNVMGEVMTPGTYTLSAFATVFHALYMAGGINEVGTLRDIKVYRKNRLVGQVDIYDYILNGKLGGNIRLADNDVIVVGPYDCLVDVTGKVKRPMFYEMKKDESLSTLLKYSGGFAGDAYTKSVRVVRKTGREYAVFNVGEFDMASFHVADGDSVSVDSILPRYENTVELKGAVFRPGMYQLGGNIVSVRTLIEQADGLTEGAFTNRAVMHRMKPDRTLEVLSVDLNGIMDGSLPDIPLRENDVLFIPSKQEAQTERTITIHGEVHYPGIYQYADNETIEDFILQAGGLLESASTAKVDVARRIVNPGALTTDSIVAQTFTFALKEGFVVEGEPGFTLQPFDEVYVRKSPGYSEQQNVTIDGEVMFRGTYTLSRNNQRLSDLIKLAGGVNDRAYTPGARLERRYNQEERLRAEAVLKKAREQAEINLQEQLLRNGAAVSGSSSFNTNQELQKYQIGETYPVGIELDKALANPGGIEDLVLREGDKLVVPRYDATVKINGEVLYPNTVGYIKGKGIGYYIDQAGGYSSKAKRRQTYIIYSNGMVAKASSRPKPLPGCEIVVPAKSVQKISLQERLSVATSVGSIAAIIATIANLLK